MMSKTFIDTNILIYSLDKHNKKKQTQSRKLLIKLAKNNQGVISTQVLQEFFVAATKKFKIDPLIIKSIMHSLLNFEVVLISPEIINEAIDCSIINKLSFWDSLIITSAEAAKCDILLSEDLNNGQIIRGVRVEHPVF